MKVKVKVKHAPLTQVEEFLNQALAETQDDLAAALAEQERLFQKNRDLERDLVCAERDFQDLKHRFSDACADRDNLEAAYKQVQASISQIVHNFEDTRKELEGEVKRVCKEKQELYAQLEEVTAELVKYEMGHYKRECEEWKQTADELADQLKDAHDRINEQQRIIADCSDTITTLKTTAELRPQFSNLWQLLKETGMIVDTEGGVHNHE